MYLLQETADFDMHFDKIYHWIASNVQERLMFFAILWKLCSKYLPKQTPLFVNIPTGIIEDYSVPETSQALDNGDNVFKTIVLFLLLFYLCI